jgi:transcriptional regulator with XRE-family HTH domain
MAQILGVSRVTFSQIEQGERELKQSELSKLATTFEMSIDDFLNDKPQPSKAPLPKEKDKHYKFKQAFLYLLNKCAQKPNI